MTGGGVTGSTDAGSVLLVGAGVGVDCGVDAVDGAATEAGELLRGGRFSLAAHEATEATTTTHQP